MKGQRKVVESYLEKAAPFRERKNKDVGIVNLLMRKYPVIKDAIEAGLVSKATIVSVVQDYASMDRSWRKVLEERPELRGADYEDKAELEHEARIDLGYKN